MSFPDESFDVVFGSGILHHLDLHASLHELSRVMRPGATGLFWEPLGHNPAINAYRDRTPHARTEDEHPLLASDFDIVRRYFSHCELEYFGLFTIASIPFRNSAAGPFIRRVGEAIDSVVLQIPGLQWQAWYVLIRLRR
jgi:SAM-dependent methyltransferase